MQLNTASFLFQQWEHHVHVGAFWLLLFHKWSSRTLWARTTNDTKGYGPGSHTYCFSCSILIPNLSTTSTSLLSFPFTCFILTSYCDVVFLLHWHTLFIFNLLCVSIYLSHFPPFSTFLWQRIPYRLTGCMQKVFPLKKIVFNQTPLRVIVLTIIASPQKDKIAKLSLLLNVANNFYLYTMHYCWM